MSAYIHTERQYFTTWNYTIVAITDGADVNSLLDAATVIITPLIEVTYVIVLVGKADVTAVHHLLLQLWWQQSCSNFAVLHN